MRYRFGLSPAAPIPTLTALTAVPAIEATTEASVIAPVVATIRPTVVAAIEATVRATVETAINATVKVSAKSRARAQRAAIPAPAMPIMAMANQWVRAPIGVEPPRLTTGELLK